MEAKLKETLPNKRDLPMLTRLQSLSSILVFAAAVATLQTAGHAQSAMAADTVAPVPVMIDLWLRKPGADLGTKSRGKLVKLDIAGLKVEEVNMLDIQYDAKSKYQGIHLRDLVTVFKPLLVTADVMLLHTKAGMIVPVAFEDLRQNRELFIATNKFQNGKWTTDFRDSMPPKESTEHPKPIIFEGNKIVAGAGWRKKQGNFTPWRHVDSLKSIELVDADAYFRQFMGSKKPASDRGRVIYATRCHFCHAVNGIGGRVGPDFSSFSSLPIADLKKRIFNQVTNPADKFWSKAHSMPEQTDFKEGDAEDLAHWIQAQKGVTPSPYEPAYAKEITSWD